jgi:FAD/FMN-containing dehydrogenase
VALRIYLERHDRERAHLPDTSAAEREAARSWLTRSWAIVRPWGSGRAYQNFPNPELEDWAHAYYGTNYDRLMRIKRKYDPDDFFRFSQSISSRDPGSGLKSCV